jgi:dipeptidyl aminopeptidase/acylaminoacyl peptidase
MTGGGRRSLALFAVGALAATVGCSSSSSSGGDGDATAATTTTTTQPQPETYEPGDIATRTESFIDATRPTAATDFSPAEASRTLETTIAYPEPATDPLPLVVLAHGLSGDPAKFSQLMTAWAQAGYVVAVPRFPRSTDDQPGGQQAAQFGDVVNQPADVSFVIDELLRLDEEADSPLHGRIDADHIGLAGHSAGGITTYGVVYNSCCRDDRIEAAMLLAAPRDLITFPDGSYEPRSIPALLIMADGDFVYEQSNVVYPELAPPKWLITLHGGDALRHASPFENAPDPSDQLVVEATVAFWDLQLKDRADAAQTLTEAAQPPDGSASLEHEE